MTKILCWLENFSPHFAIMKGISDKTDYEIYGIINVNDIIVTINIILGSEQFILSADINMDGLIDVIDVILLVNLIIT